MVENLSRLQTLHHFMMVCCKVSLILHWNNHCAHLCVWIKALMFNAYPTESVLLLTVWLVQLFGISGLPLSRRTLSFMLSTHGCSLRFPNGGLYSCTSAWIKGTGNKYLTIKFTISFFWNENCWIRFVSPGSDSLCLMSVFFMSTIFISDRLEKNVKCLSMLQSA